DPLLSEDLVTLGSAFLASYAVDACGMVELRLRPLRLTNTVSERPTASPLARWQVTHEGHENITNLRHESVPVPDHVRMLLPLLDGTRDREAHLNELIGLWRRGGLQVKLEGVPATDETKSRELLRTSLEQQLTWIARAGLLVG